MKRRAWFRRLPILIAALALFVSACEGSDDPGPPPIVKITIQPQPVATVLPGCDAFQLQEWLERVGTLVYTYNNEALAGLTRPEDEITLVLDRLISLRDRIASQPVPDCASEVHDHIVEAMRGILLAYQRYENGDITSDQLRAEVEAGNDLIGNQVTAMIDDTANQLEELLQTTVTPEPVFELIPLTIEPRPEVTLLPDCDDAQLQAWLERADTLIRTFDEEALAGINLAQHEVLPLVDRLTRLRDDILLQPMPDCASDVYNQVATVMQDILLSYQSYNNGDVTQEQLVVEIEVLHQIIQEDIVSLLDDTAAQIESSIRATPSTEP